MKWNGKLYTIPRHANAYCVAPVFFYILHNIGMLFGRFCHPLTNTNTFTCETTSALIHSSAFVKTTLSLRQSLFFTSHTRAWYRAASTQAWVYTTTTFIKRWRSANQFVLISTKDKTDLFQRQTVKTTIT